MSAATEGPPRRRRSVLGVLALVVAIGLGAAGAWLIVTGDTKQTKIGVLLGLWGLLLGAYQIVGSRHAAEAEGLPPAAPAPTTALDTREDAEAMRRYEQRLEAMLRRQIEMMSAEMATMRAELVTLRSELVEKVGGQLRLERTETTRLIGSDIGALQNEVRQLMRVAGIEEPARAVLTPAPRVTLEAAPVESPAPVSPYERPAPAPAPAPAPVRAEPEAPTAPAAAASAIPNPPPTPTPAPKPTATPAPQPAAARPAAAGGTDPFASLPRLTPFHDDAPPTSTPAGEPATGHHLAPAPGAFDAALGLADPAAAASVSGRHAQPADSGSGGGRRRRAEEGESNNVLARILARERDARG